MNQAVRPAKRVTKRAFCSRLAAPDPVYAAGDEPVTLAPVTTGTVKVAMPPVGADTVTVVLEAPVLRLEAADFALE